MKVAVIGCGPAGLAAAHAAFGLGAEVTIYSPGVKSPQRGPLLLQRPIPGITTDHPFGYIRQIVIGGSIMDYRYKLYGDINIGINGDILQPGYHAWDHFLAYDELWARYMMAAPDRIVRVDRTVTGRELRSMSSIGKWDLVVNTAPLHQLCRLRLGEHSFESAEVVVAPYYSYPDQPEDTIIFNAGNSFSWVRSSRVFGNDVTEWLPGAIPENGGRVIHKPIKTDCNCFPRVLLTGRFGSWRNETWVDSAYYAVRDAIISTNRKEIWDGVR